MQFNPNHIYHIYNQGNNRQRIFLEDSDYFIFLRLFKNLVLPHLEVIAWCLMPNHFHLMAYIDERISHKQKQGGLHIDPVTNGLRKLLSGYARIFNTNYERTGSLFRQKTKIKCITDIAVLKASTIAIGEYLQSCFTYSHQNPVRTGMVTKAEDWQFSSFRDYAGLREGKICHKSLAIQYCGYQEKEFLSSGSLLINPDILKEIR